MQFHEIFFDQIPFFAISKMAKNQILKWEKVFKIAKNAISQKKFDLFDFTNFFPWTFLNFLVRAVVSGTQSVTICDECL